MSDAEGLPQAAVAEEAPVGAQLSVAAEGECDGTEAVAQAEQGGSNEEAGSSVQAEQGGSNEEAGSGDGRLGGEGEDDGGAGEESSDDDEEPSDQAKCEEEVIESVAGRDSGSDDDRELLRHEIELMKREGGGFYSQGPSIAIDWNGLDWNEADVLTPAGHIYKTIGSSSGSSPGVPRVAVLKAATTSTSHLDTGSILFSADHAPIGVVEETFGPIALPYYALILNPNLRFAGCEASDSRQTPEVGQEEELAAAVALSLSDDLPAAQPEEGASEQASNEDCSSDRPCPLPEQQQQQQQGGEQSISSPSYRLEAFVEPAATESDARRAQAATSTSGSVSTSREPPPKHCLVPPSIFEIGSTLFYGKVASFVPPVQELILEAPPCDASGLDDREIPLEDQEFSDDQKEAERRSLMKRPKKRLNNEPDHPPPNKKPRGTHFPRGMPTRGRAYHRGLPVPPATGLPGTARSVFPPFPPRGGFPFQPRS